MIGFGSELGPDDLVARGEADPLFCSRILRRARVRLDSNLGPFPLVSEHVTCRGSFPRRALNGKLQDYLVQAPLADTVHHLGLETQNHAASYRPGQTIGSHSPSGTGRTIHLRRKRHKMGPSLVDPHKRFSTMEELGMWIGRLQSKRHSVSHHLVLLDCAELYRIHSTLPSVRFTLSHRAKITQIISTPAFCKMY